MQIESLIYHELEYLNSCISDYNYEEFENDIYELLGKISDDETKELLLALLDEELDSSVHWIIPKNILYHIKNNNIKIV